MREGESVIAARVKGKLMQAILRDPAQPALLAAIDRNWRASMRAFGLAPHVQLRDDDQVFWFITGVPDAAFNSIMYAHLSLDQIAAVVCELQTLRATYAVPMNWLVGPNSRPADLGQRLVNCGLQHFVDLPLMTVDLTTRQGKQIYPANLAIEQVTSESLLTEWIATERAAFEVDPPLIPALAALRMGMGVGHHLPLYHFLGWLGVQPVATASLLLAEGIAGVYDVATVPNARKCGIGTAMMQHVLQVARAHGYYHAWLQPSEMGYRFYEQLGFRVCGTCGIFG